MIKPRLATDTCSLIFMYETGLLNTAAQYYTFFITPLIFLELEKRATKEELLQYQKFTVLLNVDSKGVDDCALPKGSGADKSLLALYRAINGAAVLSEDGPVLKYCKKNNIPHFCCLSLVADMARENVLSREKALMYFKNLKTCGRYADWVIEAAYNMLEGK